MPIVPGAGHGVLLDKPGSGHRMSTDFRTEQRRVPDRCAEVPEAPGNG
jgi:hypothetical protein